MVLYFVEAVYLREFVQAPSRRHVSLVREDEEHGVFQLVMHEHGQELGLGRLHLGVICAINYEYHGVSVCIVGIPGGPQVLLTT